MNSEPSPGDDQFEPKEQGKVSVRKNSPKRVGSPKRPLNRSTKTGPFDPRFSRDEIMNWLCEVLDGDLEKSVNEDTTIDNTLSVNDLRGIARALALLPSDLANGRKKALIGVLQDFLMSEEMIEAVARYWTARGEPTRPAPVFTRMERAAEREKEKSSSAAPPTAAAQTAAAASAPRRRGPGSAEDRGRRPPVPRFRIHNEVAVDDYLAFFAEVNDFVVGVNRDLCEMERITSVLARRSVEMREAAGIGQ